MPKEHSGSTSEISEEDARRLFTLTPDDLYFLRTTRVDSQRLYRALVLLWARVERVLLSETGSIVFVNDIGDQFLIRFGAMVPF